MTGFSQVLLLGSKGLQPCPKPHGLNRFISRGSRRPSHDRRVYREVVNRKLRRFVEIGMGRGERARRLISLADRHAADTPISYTGIDLFEDRPHASRGMSLKEAHRGLAATGAQVRLLPGEPARALARCVNELRGTDLLLISRDYEWPQVAAAWHFLPRFLHDKSQVWIAGGKNGGYRVLSVRDVQEQLMKGCQRKVA